MPRSGLTNIFEETRISLNISYSGGPAAWQPQKSPTRGPIFGAPRLASPALDSDLERQYHPFLINKAEYITVQKKKNGPLIFEINLSPNSSIVRKIVNGKHVPNPWLHQLRIGKNPSAKYLAEINSQILSPQYLGQKLFVATTDHPIRWASGGGMVIIKDKEENKLVPVSIRDKMAIHGGKFDAQGGLSSSINDWLHPQELALREIKEELILLEKGRQIQLSPLNDITPADKRAVIKVNYKGHENQTEGLVFLDPSSGSLDLRNIYEYKVSSIKDLTIIDGERDGRGETSGREIWLFNLKDLLDIVNGRAKEIRPEKRFVNGKSIVPKAIRIDKNIQDIFAPVLLGMLRTLC